MPNNSSPSINPGPPPLLHHSHAAQAVGARVQCTHLDQDPGVAAPAPVRIAAGAGLAPSNGVGASPDRGLVGGAVADATHVHRPVHVRAGAVEGGVDAALDVVPAIGARLAVDLDPPVRRAADLPAVRVVRDHPERVGPGLSEIAIQDNGAPTVGSVCSPVLCNRGNGTTAVG